MKQTLLLAAIILSGFTASAAKPNDTCSIITFAIIGDYGNNDSNEQHVADMVYGWNPDFIVTVGDNSYDDDKGDNLDINVGKYYSKYIYNPKNPKVKVDSSGKAFAQRKNLFFPCMGNHDAKNEESYTNYLKYFGVPKNYSFTQGPCSFYFFYSGPHGHSNGQGEFDEDTKSFIRSSLDDAKNDKFKLVFFHHPPHTSSPMGSPKINAAFDFDTMHVDAVICGHEHQYERITHANENPTPVYIVNGSGGAELTPDKYIDRKALGPEFVSHNLDNHHFGAMKATVICTKTSKVIYFEYYTTDGHAAQLEDKFFLEK